MTERVKNAHADDERVGRIERIGSTEWWVARSPSVRLPRTLAGYTEHLGPILRCSNSLLFIDPHLDPAQGRYREFSALIEMAGHRAPAPAIEIHRVCYEGSGRERQFPLRQDKTYFRRRFGAELGVVYRPWVSRPKSSSGTISMTATSSATSLESRCPTASIRRTILSTLRLGAVWDETTATMSNGSSIRRAGGMSYTSDSLFRSSESSSGRTARSISFNDCDWSVPARETGPGAGGGPSPPCGSG